MKDMEVVYKSGEVFNVEFVVQDLMQVEIYEESEVLSVEASDGCIYRMATEDLSHFTLTDSFTFVDNAPFDKFTVVNGEILKQG